MSEVAKKIGYAMSLRTPQKEALSYLTAISENCDYRRDDNLIADNDAIVVAQRTQDTVRYIRWEWNKEHADPIDEEELRLFLCDEYYGDLTDEQKTVARRCRDEMRSVYAELCVRLLQSEIMLERGMVPDSSTYRSVFCPEGGDAPWMLDRAG